MIERILNFSVAQRSLVVLLTAAALAWFVMRRRADVRARPAT